VGIGKAFRNPGQIRQAYGKKMIEGLMEPLRDEAISESVPWALTLFVLSAAASKRLLVVYLDCNAPRRTRCSLSYADDASLP
jgi:hypothetical protein